MKKLKSFILGIISLFLILSLISLSIYIPYLFFKYLQSIPKELGAALIAAGTTIFVATATVMIGRFYERQKELDALYRDKKTEIYDEFLKELFKHFFNQNKSNEKDEYQEKKEQEELIEFLQDFIRKLILWSGPEVIDSFVKWKDNIQKQSPDINTIMLMEDFLKAIRSDLRHSNEKLQKGFWAKLFLQNGALLLEVSKKYPNITLSDFSKIEKELSEK